jgi:hypothetical protein
MNRLPNNNLPDFTKKKVDMLTAAKMFKAAIDKICEDAGMQPSYETNMATAEDYGYGDDKTIVVNFEAGPFEWGVNYSLGSNPKSYNPGKNIQDWYLECYYGFDVMFVSTLDNAPSFKSIKIADAPEKNMRPKMDVVIQEGVAA